MRRIKQLLVILLGLLPWAAANSEFYTASTGSSNIGTLAGNLNQPINIARYFFSGGSYVLGAGFLIAAFFRFLRFRQNPQESPISMVIVLTIIGIVLIILPFSYQLSNYLSVEHGVGDVIQRS